MDRRHIPAVTVTALMVIVALGAAVGWRAATAPLPEEEREATPAELCVATIAVGDRVEAGKVRVSDKTRRPIDETIDAVRAILSGGDFYDPADESEDDGDPASDLAIRAYA